MYLTGALLTSTVPVRADALTDLRDLKGTINSAANTIGAATNSSRNWGFLPAVPSSVGTADLLTNITLTAVRANSNVNINETGWVNATIGNYGITNSTGGTNSTPIYLDDPYIEYVNAIPNLAAALTALGQAWHRELNAPVSAAISALQSAMSEFSTSLLQAGLVHSNSTLRTIRASSTLENAQQAWSRILNLPGPQPSSQSSQRAPSIKTRRAIAAHLEILRSPRPRVVSSATFTHQVREKVSLEEEDKLQKDQRAIKLPIPPKGKVYSHQDLWDNKSRPSFNPLPQPRIARTYTA
ncbi:hypothetical protein BCR34DRAFT_586654 [Clohesyomyces aquaticus]|uniref:Uncharacterized protein n=1 Tax=Clohesyomyces aquaticus TaxID=1231657 RepID=A0A1Y1ZSX9_9PLEO|nr:hypothetical protein BCR34DRAFT_586654 [Clohesyomyces aquaticus]